MSATVKPLPTKPVVAKITSKGQITIPVEIRRLLGAKAGDKLAFEPTPEGIRVSRQIDQSVIEKTIGTSSWLPPGYEGREGIIRYFRELRGHDEIDDLIFGAEP
jgi:antitoxin PrlF